MAPGGVTIAELFGGGMLLVGGLAVVTEDGEIVGLLTLTNAFEEVMGDLEDPIDKRSERAHRGANPTGT